MSIVKQDLRYLEATTPQAGVEIFREFGVVVMRSVYPEGEMTRIKEEASQWIVDFQANPTVPEVKASDWYLDVRNRCIAESLAPLWEIPDERISQEQADNGCDTIQFFQPGPQRLDIAPIDQLFDLKALDHSLMDNIMDAYYPQHDLFSIQGLIENSGARTAQVLHRDTLPLKYEDWKDRGHEYGVHEEKAELPVILERAYCVGCVALHDMGKANGVTGVIPGSHVIPMEEMTDEYLDTELVFPELKRGDAMIFNGTTAHVGGANSTDGKRLLLYKLYSPKQHYEALQAEDERLKQK